MDTGCFGNKDFLASVASHKKMYFTKLQYLPNISFGVDKLDATLKIVAVPIVQVRRSNLDGILTFCISFENFLF